MICLLKVFGRCNMAIAASTWFLLMWSPYIVVPVVTFFRRGYRWRNVEGAVLIFACTMYALMLGLAAYHDLMGP